MYSPEPIRLTRRAAAILRAVGSGRVEITCGCEPDMRVDGLHCCDQTVAHDLTHCGFVRPVRPGRPGQWVSAVLTASGHDALTSLPHAA